MMFLQNHPRIAWLPIFILLWAYIGMPVLAASNDTGNAPSATGAVSSLVPSADEAPKGGDPPPCQGAPASAVPAANDAAPNAAPIPGPRHAGGSAGLAPGLQVTGDSGMLLLLQQQMNNPHQSRNLPNTLPLPSTLGINGALQENVFLNATVNQGVGAPMDTHWNMRYNGKSQHMAFGEIPAVLEGNELVGLNRQVRGLQFDTMVAKGSFVGVLSQLNAPLQTDALIGQNSSGPYTLSRTPIITSSETIMVDGQQMTPIKDYTLDTNLGALRFAHAVASTSHICASYQVQVNGVGEGTLLAARGAYPLSKSLTVGLSHISLISSSSNGGRQTESDEYLVKNVTDCYTLNYRPVDANSEMVTVNGVRQTAGVAYTLNDSTGVLLFANGHYPPIGAAVRVAYSVTPSNQNGTTRSISGIDMDWKATHQLGFNLQTAMSSNDSTPTAAEMTPVSISNEMLCLQPGIPLVQQLLYLHRAPIRNGSESVRLNGRLLTRNQDYIINVQTGMLQLFNSAVPAGTTASVVLVSYTTAPVIPSLQGSSAFIATSNFQSGAFTAMARYRSTDAGYSPLETMGNNTLRHGYDWSSSYAPLKALTLSTSGDNSLLSTFAYLNGASLQPTQALTGTSLLSQQQNRSYTLAYVLPNWPSLTLQHANHNDYQVTDRRLSNASTGDTLTSTWEKGPLTATLNLTHTTGEQHYLTTGGHSTASTGVSNTLSTNDNASVNVTYAPGERLNLALNVSGTRGVSDTDGYQATNGGQNYQFTATYNPKSTLTFSANLESNHSNPVPIPSAPALPGSQSSNFTLNNSWQPAKRVTIATDLNFGGSRTGSMVQNATQTLGSNIRWQIRPQLLVSCYGAQQFTRDSITKEANGQNHLIGMGAQCNPSRNSTVTWDAQRVWGVTDDSVNALWQSAGLPRRLTTAIADASSYQVNGSRLTALNGSYSYHLGDKLSFSLMGQLLYGVGIAGTDRQQAFGIGWNFLPLPTFTLSLTAARVYTTQSQAPAQHSNTLNASMNWKF